MFCRAPFYYTGTKEKKQVRCGLLGRRDTAKAARGIPGGFGCDEEGDCAFPARGGAGAFRRAYRRTPTWRRFPRAGKSSAFAGCYFAQLLRGSRASSARSLHSLCAAPAKFLRGFRTVFAQLLHSLCAVSAQLLCSFRAVSARLLCSFCTAFAPFPPALRGRGRGG